MKRRRGVERNESKIFLNNIGNIGLSWGDHRKSKFNICYCLMSVRKIYTKTEKKKIILVLYHRATDVVGLVISNPFPKNQI